MRALIVTVAVLLIIPASVMAQVTSSDNPCATPTILGTRGNDTLNGTPGDDVIDARPGNDVIYG
ncbi:MAG: calcium-binding protein, partial [Thermodesulfobacteriota bacterium]